MKSKNFDYKREIIVLEKEERIPHPAYRVVTKGDDRGWNKQAKIYRKGPQWANPGEKIITLQEFDGNCFITFHKDGTEVNLTLCDLGELRVLLECLQRTEKLQLFTPCKIATVTETRLMRTKKKEDGGR